MIKNILKGLTVPLFVSLLAGAAYAQSSPGLRTGQVPTAAQWNSYFSAKQDVLGYTPVNRAGDTMLGRLALQPSATGSAMFNIPPGGVPDNPGNGDIWVTSSGLFFRNNGLTIGPIGQTSPPCGNCAFVDTQNQFSALQTVNLTGATLPAPVAGTVLRIAQQVGTSSRFEADAFAGSPTFTGVRYNGTPTAPSGVLNGNTVMQFIGQGYTGSGVSGGRGAFTCAATEDWSSSTQGTKCTVLTTTNGTSSSTTAMTFDHNGGITIGSPTGGNKGAFTVNSQSIFYVNGNATASTASSPLAIDSSGNISLAGVVTVASGGTNATTQAQAALNVLPTPTRPGDILYHNGTNWVTVAGNNSGNKVLQEDASGAPSWSSGVGVTSFNSRTGDISPRGEDYGQFSGVTGYSNCSLNVSVASNNVTFTLLSNQGAASGTQVCTINFRDPTVTNSGTTSINVTSNLSITLNSGSTLGFSNNNDPFRVWITAFSVDGVNATIGVSTQSDGTPRLFPLDETSVKSTTACNACSSALTVGTIYTSSAQTNRPFRIIGYAEWSSGLATAGSWAAGPTKIQMFGPGIKKPGETVQFQYNSDGTQRSTTSTTFADIGSTVSMSLTSSMNLVKVRVAGGIGQGSASFAIASMYRGGAASGTQLGVGCPISGTTTGQAACTINAIDRPKTTSSTTYGAAMKSGTAATSVFWGDSANTTIQSDVYVEEIQG